MAPRSSMMGIMEQKNTHQRLPTVSRKKVLILPVKPELWAAGSVSADVSVPAAVSVSASVPSAGFAGAASAAVQTAVASKAHSSVRHRNNSKRLCAVLLDTITISIRAASPPLFVFLGIRIRRRAGSPVEQGGYMLIQSKGKAHIDQPLDQGKRQVDHQQRAPERIRRRNNGGVCPIIASMGRNLV